MLVVGPAADPAARLGPTAVTWRSIIQGCGRELRERILATPEREWSTDAALLLALASSFRTARGTNPFAAIDYLDAADELLKSPAAADPTLRVIAPMMRSVTYRELGHFDDARHQLLLALEHLYSAEIPLQSRFVLHAVILQHEGICQTLQSEFDGARRNLLRGLRLAEACAPWCPRAEGYGCVALIDFLIGRVHDAEANIQCSLAAVLQGDGVPGLCITPALLAQALVRIERRQLDEVARDLDLVAADATATGYAPLVMYAAAIQRESLGDDDGAMEALQELQLLIRDWEPSLAHRLHHLARISILTRRREPSAVRDLLAQLKPDPSHSMCPAQAEARLELESGDFERAIELTTECLRLGDDHAPRTYAYASLINAASRVALGDLSTADAIFERSLALAASSGLLRPFTSLPQLLLASLVSRAQVASHPQSVNAVLAEIAATLPEEAPPTPGLLSPCERVVLGHIVAGETQQQISRLLSVSPNTVKTQVRSVYRKLGVASCHGAVQRARMLGIIE